MLVYLFGGFPLCMFDISVVLYTFQILVHAEAPVTFQTTHWGSTQAFGNSPQARGDIQAHVHFYTLAGTFHNIAGTFHKLA